MPSDAEPAASAPVAPGAPATAWPRWASALVVAIFTVAAGLRLVLGLFNDAANDDHLRVVQYLLAGRRGLTLAACLECFQPKLYYHLLAGLIRAGNIRQIFWQIRAGQFLDVAAGVLTLWLLHRFLLRRRLAYSVHLLVLALVALNPAFLAINVQLTNDSWAVLCTAAGTAWLYRYLGDGRARHLAGGAVGLGLGVATKGTAWVAGIAAVLALALAAFSRRPTRPGRRWRGFVLAPALALLLVGVIGVAGYDFDNLGGFGRRAQAAPLHLFERTQVRRPGVVSIYDSYFSFKFADLLRSPYTTNLGPVEPPHRTSVPSQLYGRLHFLHLDSWPSGWERKDALAFAVGRYNLVLGLLPTAVFFIGFALGLGGLVRAMRSVGWRAWLREADTPTLLCLLVCLGSAAFMIRFTSGYRDFSAMKPVYVFPGIVAFVKVFADGYAWVGQRLAGRPVVRALVWTLSGCLLVGYVADALLLAQQLYVRNAVELGTRLGLRLG
jgi:hypothetical protein